MPGIVLAGIPCIGFYDPHLECPEFRRSIRIITSNTANVNITVVENVPTLADITKNVPKNTFATFSAADFNAQFTDADSGDNNNLQTLKIMTLPAYGTLNMVNGTTSTAVTVGQLSPAGQISQLEYVAQNGYLGTDSFTWNASDGLRFADSDAIVNLTNRRYLIEGQGNFGNIFTGDVAAAPRYIECRLTELARNELFNAEITDFVPSYDGRNK